MDQSKFLPGLDPETVKANIKPNAMRGIIAGLESHIAANGETPNKRELLKKMEERLRLAKVIIPTSPPPPDNALF